MFLVALLFSLIFKKADMEDAEFEQDEECIELADNEQWMHFYPDSKSSCCTSSIYMYMHKMDAS